jgi:trehalose 6-phosphate synthase/phosphatase
MLTTEAGESNHPSTRQSSSGRQRFHSSLASSSQWHHDLGQIKRLVIVSNRLPIVLHQSEEGGWCVEPGSGGLVTALTPVLRAREGVWIGWPGTSEAVELNGLLTADGGQVGYNLQQVPLSETDVEGYYRGFANEIIWPLFHDVQSRCHFDPTYWAVYQGVNHMFAQVVAKNVADGDYIWVHDYHLLLVASYLRAMGIEQQLGFFLHTPFPPLDVFIKLPWRQQILEGLMAYDLLGFQTLRDRSNFLACAEALLDVELSDLQQPIVTVATDKRRIRVGHFSISIDFDEFDQLARTSEVVERVKTLRAEIPDGKRLLGVDRLDYSKGIPERLEAFQCVLERFPELRGKLTLVQVVVPSRVDIPEYQRLRTQIEELVSRINGTFTQPGWVPIHYLYRSLERSELVAFYRTADIALITPLKDGMNLIAKEYCAANVDCDGVLILSEFAGAATQLGQHALLVNPYDIHGVADAIQQACEMSPRERLIRMGGLRQIIRTQNIFRWVDTFLKVAFTKEREVNDASRRPKQEPRQHDRKRLFSSAASVY